MQLGIIVTYIEANSDSTIKTDVVPNQTTIYPYTKPAGPPLELGRFRGEYSVMPQFILYCYSTYFVKPRRKPLIELISLEFTPCTEATGSYISCPSQVASKVQLNPNIETRPKFL
jgi:hypothetical protein